MKKSKTAVPKVDPYLESLMGKLLEHLVVLEKKMDSVLSRLAPSTPSSANVPSSAPPQNHQQNAPRRDRTLYEAICADCHKVCEVPFKPSEDRAVYCKECFARRKSGQGNNRPQALTPVSLPPKPKSQLGIPPPPPPPATPAPSKKAAKRPAPKKKKTGRR